MKRYAVSVLWTAETTYSRGIATARIENTLGILEAHSAAEAEGLAIQQASKNILKFLVLKLSQFRLTTIKNSDILYLCATMRH